MAVNCSVYWIHLPTHTDATCEGYVGITVRRVKDRLQQHVNKAKRGNKYTISNAINKYGGQLVCTELLQGSVDHCRLIEQKLRPLAGIGWNINVGGDVPPMSGRKHSEASKLKMSQSNNRGLSKASMLKNIVKVNPWESYKANKTLWRNANNIYDIIQANPALGYSGVQRILGVPRAAGNANSIFDRIKQGYVPSQDPAWVDWASLNQGELS